MPNGETSRMLTYAHAIREAQAQCLADDKSVYVMGLGVPDPKGVFGTTLGLQEKFGVDRVFDIPLAENAMTGVAIGSSLVGMRPILVHQRIDFALVSLEQILNQAAKWHYMFGGKSKAPIVIRMVIGRGWGQGPQHSQSLQSLFAHFPGLRVVMPVTAFDAKGMLISSVKDDNPVIFLEHRWLHNIEDAVPEGAYDTPIDRACIRKAGNDITIIAASYMVIEALRAAKELTNWGVSAEVLDLRSISPLDKSQILSSAKKTGRVIIVDTGWKSFGISAEISSMVTEALFDQLRAAPRRVAMPDNPVPTSWNLAKSHYPTHRQIICEALEALGITFNKGEVLKISENDKLDTPSSDFTGPF